MSGALLVAGTSSDAGKSLVVAGLCRLLARKGIAVAPFKAQNMSNNSAVTVEGGEIGRAQAMQARAAGLAPSVRFNPILLKPGSDRTSQLVVCGRVAGTVAAGDYFTHRDRLSAVVADELAGLRAEFDAVICEGAGSPAEINLRATDLANMGLARAAHLPVVLVGDIDRGGLLAHLFGTVAVLAPEDQALIAGFVVNKFRGDPALLAPGLTQLQQLTGRPTYGVIPFDDGFWLDAEDSVSVSAHRVVGRPQPPRRRAVAAGGGDPAAPHLQLHRRRGAGLRAWRAGALGERPGDLPDADVVVIPGSKATVADLPGCGTAGWPTQSWPTPISVGPCSASAVASRCCAAASTTLSSPARVASTASACSTPTSCSRRTRRCAGTTPRCTATRSTTARWRGRPTTTGSASGSGAARSTARTGTACSTTTVCGGTGWPRPPRRRADGFVVADDVDVSARRDAQLDLMADLLAAHADIDAILGSAGARAAGAGGHHQHAASVALAP